MWFSSTRLNGYTPPKNNDQQIGKGSGYGDVHLISSANTFSGVQIQTCTPDQLLLIQQQLPPHDCETNKRQPWTQQCSFSYATQCPDATWIEDFYSKKHKTKSNRNETFTGMFVGCNKGMDAVNTLRMGSGNPSINKDEWKIAMTRGGKETLGGSVCNQANLPQFELHDHNAQHNNKTSSESQSTTLSQVHCIEPMPSTYQALSQSAKQLQWDAQGLIVTHAAISKSNGTIPFPSGKAGRENLGIANCDGHEADGVNCVNVDMFSLDTYVQKFVHHDGPIDFLSIDVEGFDIDVILGGPSTLKRVHYLEFEYNWMGSWKNQKLSETIRLLDETFNFTCYWPGYDGNIWRITDCWLDYYDLHFWSNVACVNRGVEQMKDVAEDMERLFLETLEKGIGLVMDVDHRGGNFQHAKTGDL